MPNESTRRNEQLKDRRDLRRSLIERRNGSKSESSRSDLDRKIAEVEQQIRVLSGAGK